MLEIENWHGADELTVAVGGRDEHVAQCIDQLGAESVAAMAAEEIKERVDASNSVPGEAVNLVFRHQDHAFRYALSFKDSQAFLDHGEAADALAEISYSLLDLVRLLYRHRADYHSTSRDVRVLRWPWSQPRGGELLPGQLDEMVRSGQADPERLSNLGQQRLARLFRTVQCVLAAVADGTVSLNELSARYGSDKWGGLHWYTPHYMDHFTPMRYDPIRLLEIGIGGYNYESLGGESLYMWQRYFPRGLIYGMDLYAKPGVRGSRIRTIRGDQNDPEFLRHLGATAGPFDIIIDDGSHLNEHVRTSFTELYPYVRPGGYYVIEDLYTSYWPEFGGTIPPSPPSTSVGLLRDLLDSLHASEHAPAGQATGEAAPSGVEVYHDIAFLRKGIRPERGVPDWIRKASTQAGSFGNSSTGGRAAGD